MESEAHFSRLLLARSHSEALRNLALKVTHVVLPLTICDSLLSTDSIFCATDVTFTVTVLLGAN